jgi:hypothetical protein
MLEDPRYYLNRHVQWLDFNRRVLEETRDPGNPLLECAPRRFILWPQAAPPPKTPRTNQPHRTP